MVIVGAGNMGLCIAGAFAKTEKVKVCDINEALVEAIDDGTLPINEPDVDLDKIAATATMPKDDLYLVCVQTPAAVSGCDYTAIQRCLTDIARFANKDAIVVIMSTIFPTGMGNLLVPLERLGRMDLIGKLLYHPVFLRAGHGVADYRDPGKVVIGHNGTPTGTAAARRFWDVLRHCVSKAPTYCTWEVAEWVKMIHNAFMCTKVVFANEMGSLSGTEALAIALKDDRLMSRSHTIPGPPYSGQCLPKDALILQGYLCDQNKLLHALYDSNVDHVGKIIAAWNKPGKLGIIGMAMRPGYDDIRGSLGLTLATWAIANSRDVLCYEPMWLGRTEQDALLLARGDKRVLQLVNTIRSTTLSDVCRCDSVVVNRPLEDAETVLYKAPKYVVNVYAS